VLWVLVVGASGSRIAESAQAFPLTPSRALTPSADIEVFVRPGCPYCVKAKAFLSALGREQPELRIVVHDIHEEPGALLRLKAIAQQHNIPVVRVPAFYVRGQLILGYSDDLTTGRLIRNALAQSQVGPSSQESRPAVGSCAAEDSTSCEATAPVPEAAGAPESVDVPWWGQRIALEQVGLPLFTVAMGLLDGLNPCSMWVLILMISLLAPMGSRRRMLAIAGVFVAVEGIAYFIFMAAWLNLFLLIGLSRVSELLIAAIALVAGAINLKDFWAYGWGVSLSIPTAAKPGLYARMRRILQANNVPAAMVGAVVLAILVQMVEFMCTSGFPALFTRILTLRQLRGLSYYGYLLLYNLAYMLDDIIVLSIGIITLSQRRLQEQEGRWLKLISGLVMVMLGVYLALLPYLEGALW
jgi:glutaredoxin